MPRHFLSPELEKEIREDERQKARAALIAELAGTGDDAEPTALSRADLERMTVDEVNARWNDVCQALVQQEDTAEADA